MMKPIFHLIEQVVALIELQINMSQVMSLNGKNYIAKKTGV